MEGLYVEATYNRSSRMESEYQSVVAFPTNFGRVLKKRRNFLVGNLHAGKCEVP
jgi:hypothetical protein